jgi:ribonuclease HII
MIELDAQYPGYGLAKHKGYITAAHTKALETLGVAVIHRKSYANIAKLLVD